MQVFMGSAFKGNTYLLKIPNYEIKAVFQDIIMAWLHQDVKVQRELLISTAEHLVNNSLQAFEKGFKKIMGDTFSYFDTGGEAEKGLPLEGWTRSRFGIRCSRQRRAVRGRLLL